jgi:hypothetical protein
VICGGLLETLDLRIDLEVLRLMEKYAGADKCVLVGSGGLDEEYIEPGRDVGYGETSNDGDGSVESGKGVLMQGGGNEGLEGSGRKRKRVVETVSLLDDDDDTFWKSSIPFVKVKEEPVSPLSKRRCLQDSSIINMLRTTSESGTNKYVTTPDSRILNTFAAASVSAVSTTAALFTTNNNAVANTSAQPAVVAIDTMPIRRGDGHDTSSRGTSTNNVANINNSSQPQPKLSYHEATHLQRNDETVGMASDTARLTALREQIRYMRRELAEQ